MLLSVMGTIRYEKDLKALNCNKGSNETRWGQTNQNRERTSQIDHGVFQYGIRGCGWLQQLAFRSGTFPLAGVLFACADWRAFSSFKCRDAVTQEGLLERQAHGALSAVSLTPFSFVPIIEFAAFSFNLIAFCVTSKKSPQGVVTNACVYY